MGINLRKPSGVTMIMTDSAFISTNKNVITPRKYLII